MTKTETRKLTLNRESLRLLTESSHLVAGMPQTIPGNTCVY